MDPVIAKKSTPAVDAASTTSTPLHESLAYPVTPTEPAVSHFDTTVEPEHKIPGSLPPSAENTDVAGQSMLESAKQYIPSQQVVQDTLQNARDAAQPYIQNVQQTLQRAGETAGPYFQSISSTLPGAQSGSQTNDVLSQSGTDGTQLPSKETPSGSAVGVGSLPGSNSEANVGKLPEERALKGSSNGMLATAQQSLNNAGQTMKEYTPQVTAIPASQSVSNAGQAIKEYLPETVATKSPGTQSQAKQTTLPSNETPSGSNVGVGSLPGTKSEVSVAKLPHERLQENLPSRETGQEVPGKTGGVGSLPGAPNESRVAVLPEERNHPQVDNNAGSLQNETKSRVAGLPTPSNIPHDDKTGALKDGNQNAPKQVIFGEKDATKSENLTGNTVQDKSLTDDKVRDNRPDPSYGAGYHPAELHPLQTASKTPDDKSKTDTPSTGKPQDVGANSPADKNGSPTSERHKVGLMSKIKGEAKVIAGKLGHNEQKVEEGKHLMGKQ